jgi:hypothetical protein
VVFLLYSFENGDREWSFEIFFSYKALQKSYAMKTTLRFALLLLFVTPAFGQIMPLTLAPDGGNKKASVSEQIGIVKISITYSRPGVRGREGKIYNTPVAHYGFVDQGHGTSHAAPWRAGANENTAITFSHPVKVEGQDLPAGSYGFFIALGEEESTLIFSKISNSWGSFYYDPTQDALRVAVKNVSLEKSVEWLKYEFTNQTDNSVVIAMSWEKRTIPFKVEADIHALQIAAFESDFRTTRPYYDYIAAADYCVRNNVALDKALAWIDRGTYFRVMGEKNFRTLSTRASVLIAMNRIEEAKRVMQEAIPLGNVTDVHYYGRTLLNLKQADEAFRIFKFNYDKNPNVFTTNVGMGRGYSAIGDYKKAMTYLKAALPQAPDELNRTSVEGMLRKLESRQDVNQ